MPTRLDFISRFIQKAGFIQQDKLVALIFLATSRLKSTQKTNYYKFLPSNEGPISFTLLQDIKRMINNGLIECHDNILRTNYKETVTDSVKHLECIINDIYQKYGFLSIDSLTKIILSYRHQQNKTEHRFSQAILTIGYEGIQLEDFFNILLESKVQLLVDVRSNPISRRYGFCKKTLISICQKIGLTYMHMPELGVPSQWRSSKVATGDMSELFIRYQNEILAQKNESIDSLIRIIKRIPTSIFCFEADPANCHRLYLAKIIADRTGFTIHDLRR